MSGSARARQRIRIDPIRLRFLSEGQEGVGRLVEVSRAGVFVEADELPRPGAVLAFQFRAPAGALVDVRGEVRWSTQGLARPSAGPGFGVSIQEAPRAFWDFFFWAQEQAEKDESREL